MRDSRTARYGALSAVLAFLVASAPTQAGSGSAAYKWTVDQRLSVRFDPADMEKRLDAIDMVPRPERGTSVVDGARNPELLLPTELFFQLLKIGFDPDPDARKLYRSRIDPVAIELGIGPELWPTLKELAAGLLPSASGKRPTWEEVCRGHFEALAASRKAFGQKAFDRLLYEAVAPRVKISVLDTSGEAEKQLRDMEDGCRESSRTPGGL